MSSDQFEQYLALGREALDEAFELQKHASATKAERFEAEAVVDRVRESLRERIDMRKRYTLWTKAVDKAAARPENRAAAAEIARGLKNQPPWEFYHSWKTTRRCAPPPTDYGFVDAETATHGGIGAWNLVPYQTYFLVQPELKTGAFLTVGDNGVNPWFTFAIGYDWPPGEYVVRVRIAATKQATPERRFMEFGVHPTLLSTHEVAGDDGGAAGDRGAVHADEKWRSLVLRPRERDDGHQRAGQSQAGRRCETRTASAPSSPCGSTGRKSYASRAPTKPMPPGLEALGIPLGDDAPASDPKELRGALERFAVEACRGNAPSAGFLDRLVGIYDQRRKAGIAAQRGAQGDAGRGAGVAAVPLSHRAVPSRVTPRADGATSSPSGSPISCGDAPPDADVARSRRTWRAAEARGPGRADGSPDR